MGAFSVDQEAAARQDVCEGLTGVGGAVVARSGVVKKFLERGKVPNFFLCDACGRSCCGKVVNLHVAHASELRVARRVSDMTRSTEEHLREVQRTIGQRPSERINIVEAGKQQRVLGADVVAVREQPSFDNSQMDGYALPKTEAHTALIGPTIAAGADPDELYPKGLQDVVAPIMTGAKLPRDTTAVVPVERCTPPTFGATGEMVRVPATERGQFMRLAGSDVQPGTCIARRGDIVTPALVGAAIGQGIDTVEVERTARILVITGGAEVTPHAQGAGPATIPDSNGPMLEVLAARHGIDVAARLLTNDDPKRLEQEVAAAIEAHQPDAIVTSGGISHGKFEVIRQVFTDGWYGHVAQQPGGPQGISTFQGVPVLSLPGNPISTIVSFVLYVAPVLGRSEPPLRIAVDTEVTGIPGKDQYLRGEIRNGRAHPFRGTGSHLLTQGATATCLIRVPDAATIPAGTPVTVYPM